MRLVLVACGEAATGCERPDLVALVAAPCTTAILLPQRQKKPKNRSDSGDRLSSCLCAVTGSPRQTSRVWQHTPLDDLITPLFHALPGFTILLPKKMHRLIYLETMESEKK